ncbi:hypothetical protein XNC1_4310 [Xenorhabdus nematophila ATCC 19061]|uniref:Uncharacterized protein n=1 Tax=Xenorhabdus nematophila (strain ATCC 19061 / DSM 3370 / CCUG 14189 / LMG 1036 / NCIMB 9965 / AN6) TaxID=406817 RepID=D3VE81_XENNA|nr:hypothetical protein XNC1_4310 [Xenorhabdus nematophila ATCC 19061]
MWLGSDRVAAASVNLYVFPTNIPKKLSHVKVLTTFTIQ